MKKNGFTLAEVLISLGIVGVIAAITLPTFTSNTQNQANASRLSSTVSTLENAFSAIIAGEGYDDLDESTFDTFYNMSRSVLHVVTPEFGNNATCILVHQKANYSALSDSINVHVNNGAVTWGDYSAVDVDVLDFAEKHRCTLNDALTHCQQGGYFGKEESEQ